MDQFSRCPRCENRTLENLQTYSHCIDCLYFEDRHYDGEKAYFQACAAEALLDEKGQVVEPQAEETERDDEIAS